MKCYRWKTRACTNVPDLCEFKRTINFNDALRSSSQSARLYSPGYSKQKFGHHFFCVYNVSLSCPSNSVIVEKTSMTNWPRQQSTDCHDRENCEKYVAFYTNRNSNQITHQYYGQTNFRKTLDSSSFIAVLWTNDERSDGIFEFQASCNDQEVLVSPTLATEEGSGNEQILGVQEE